MTATSITALLKLHLFNMPPASLVSVIASLQFNEIVQLVDLIIISNTRGRSIWHAQIKGLLRCPDMDNRKYTHDSLRWVLKKEINISDFTTQVLKDGSTELLRACMFDDAWLVGACIAFNKDEINTPNKSGWTPLHMACRSAHVDVVNLLLESGAESSLYHKDNYGDIPINDAISSGRVDMVELLLSYYNKDKKMALEKLGRAFRTAAQKQELEIVKLFLISFGTDIIHSRDSVNGRTALHESCEESDEIEVMKYLLELGAKVNAVGTNGCTPLFYAVTYRHLEQAKVLLAAGAAVNHTDTDGISPLDMALDRLDTSKTRYNIIKVLLAAGAALNNRGADGRTAMDMALTMVYTNPDRCKVIKILKAAGGLRSDQLPNDKDKI